MYENRISPKSTPFLGKATWIHIHIHKKTHPVHQYYIRIPNHTLAMNDVQFTLSGLQLNRNYWHIWSIKKVINPTENTTRSTRHDWGSSKTIHGRWFMILHIPPFYIYYHGTIVSHPILVLPKIGFPYHDKYLIFTIHDVDYTICIYNHHVLYIYI